MCHHPLLFLRLEPLSCRQVHKFSGWVIWCSIMQMSSSILALLELVIKSVIYSYSNIRGTNSWYVKHIRLVEMRCASATFDMKQMMFPAAGYSIAGILHLLLPSQWRYCFSCTHIHICIATIDPWTSWAGCCPFDLTLYFIMRSSTAPASPGVEEDPAHALLMTCQKGRVVHAAALLQVFAVYLPIPQDLCSSVRFSSLGELWPLYPSCMIPSPHYAD